MIDPRLGFATAVALACVLSLPAAEAATPAAADARSSLARLEVLRLDVPAEPRAFRSSFVLGGTHLTLDLAPYSVRSRSFRVLVQKEGGELVTRDPGPLTTLRGSILEVPGSRAVGRLLDGELEALVFLPGQRVLQIEPASRHVPDVEPGLYAAYGCGGPGALLGDGELDCGVVAEPEIADGPALYLYGGGGGADCAALGTCVAELLCDTDSALYAALDSDPGAVQSFVEYTVAVANERFDDYVPDLDIRHDISDLVIRTDPGSDPYFGSTDNGDLLARIHQEWNNPPIHTSDLVHLFTNQHGGGLSNIGGICNYNDMESVSSGASSTCDRGVLLAHELGHTWGSFHVVSGIMRQFGAGCGATWNGCQSSSCAPTCCAPTWIMQRRDQVDSICLDLQPVSGPIFDDDFETGDTSRWNGGEYTPNGGELAVIQDPFPPSYVLAISPQPDPQCPPPNPNPSPPYLFVIDESPLAETDYGASFAVDLHSLGLGTSTLALAAWVDQTPTTSVVLALRVRYDNGFQARLETYLDDGTPVVLPWADFAASLNYNYVRIQWTAASAPGASDGSVILWLDGQKAGAAVGLDNDQRAIDLVRFGLAGSPCLFGVGGSYYLDGFQSWTGPVPP